MKALESGMAADAAHPSGHGAATMRYARLFKYAVLRDEAYGEYVRDMVEPIDNAAQAAGVFQKVMTIVPQQEEDWTQGRLFTFRDRAQRDAFGEGMAAHAAAFDGSEEARAWRKRYANTLCKLIAVFDYDLC
jgi:hypothetical protein